MEGVTLAKSETEEAQERRDRSVFATKYRVTRADSHLPSLNSVPAMRTRPVSLGL